MSAGQVRRDGHAGAHLGMRRVSTRGPVTGPIRMPLTREDVRAAVERAGEEHWRALIRHHEDPYPRPAPTPGDVCRHEAARLNGLGLGTDPGFSLLKSEVRRIGEAVELVHSYRLAPDADVRQTEPFRNYAPDPE